MLPPTGASQRLLRFSVPPARKIIHLDMDCFYAAIEVRDHPTLRGHPVAVGGARDRRGVLTTCNYEARKFGVRSAMPTFMALQKCPHLIVMPVRFDVYRSESARIREILSSYSDLIEPLSLDEAYLDVSEQPRPAAEVASEIRRRIRRTTRLTASAGIGPNKLLAKIASDWNKPDGQFEVRPAEIEAFMRDLSVRKIWGIGPVAAERLEQRGIRTCGEMQQLDLADLHALFGRFGFELHQLCRGIDGRPVEPNRPRKSLSTETTFDHDCSTLESLLAEMPPLFAELAKDLSRKEEARHVTKLFAKLKFADFSKTTVERSQLPINPASFRDLITEGFGRSGQPVRLLGIGVRFAEESAERAHQLELPLELAEAVP
jgi:DNA polymerase IV